jgi:hypothetical protein
VGIAPDTPKTAFLIALPFLSLTLLIYPPYFAFSLAPFRVPHRNFALQFQPLLYRDLVYQQGNAGAGGRSAGSGIS